MKFPACVLLMVRTGFAAITVESAAVAVTELPPETLTLFTTGDAAVAATLTATRIAGQAAPAARTSAREQAFAAQVQPVPVMDVRVRPAGTVSVTVTVPLVGPAVALLETTTL